MASKIGKLEIAKTVFFLCDMQTKFAPAIRYFPEMLTVAKRMVKAATLLDIPVICTEHYPEGLGNTVPELKVLLESESCNSTIVKKTLFSMVTDNVKSHLKDINPNSVVLFGLEGHICLQQTALDLLESGLDVHVIADSTSSRTMTDRMLALERMRQSGGFITTSESALFMLMRDAKHPKFREVQKLVLESPPYQGLVSNL